MWLFRRRRRGPRWFRHTPDHRGSPASTTPPPPAPRELVEVLGIGAAQTVGDRTITLLSLERYREGDIVTFSLTSKRGLHLDFPSPELFLAVGPAASPS